MHNWMACIDGAKVMVVFTSSLEECLVLCHDHYERCGEYCQYKYGNGESLEYRIYRNDRFIGKYYSLARSFTPGKAFFEISRKKYVKDLVRSG